MANPQQNPQQASVSVEGLATVAEGNSRIMEGIAQHLREMGGRDQAAQKAEECARMCREVGQIIRR